MSDKIQKFLSKLSLKEFNLIKELISKIVSGDYGNLNVKKLEGHNDIFRLKKADIRIIFSKNNKTIEIISISRRSEKTYRDY
jgi:mRNA-degrading endonuclease RelE of RelBE toxin-antitoxin system